MISHVEIEKFRSLKRVELELVAGINLLVGESNAGKTNILRSLNWLFSNRGYKAPRSADADVESSVFVEFTEGGWAEVRRRKNLTTYTTEDDTFEKPGRDVPEQVRALLNLSELNIQQQLDPYFLITSSAGEVAREINKIIRVENAMDWLAEVNRRAKATSTESDKLKDEIDSLKVAASSYGYLLSLEALVNRHERIEKLVKRYEEQAEELSGLCTSLEQLESEVDRLGGVVDRAKEQFGILDKLTHSLVDLWQEQVCVVELLELEEQMAQFGEIDFRALRELFLEADGFTDEIETEEDNLVVLQSDLVRLGKLDVAEEELKLAVSKEARAFGSLLAKHKKCPLCFSTITKEQVDGLIKTYLLE